MKRIIGIGIGVVLIVLALVYGVSGIMVTSISERSANIARWEQELVVDQKALADRTAELDRVGKDPNASPEARESYQHGMQSLKSKLQNIEQSADMLRDQRDRKQQQTIITIAMAVLGLLAIGLGLKSRRSGGAVSAV